MSSRLFSKRAPRGRNLVVLMGLSLVGLSFSACGGESGQEGEVCEGRQLIPHLSPISFGELNPLGNREPDLSSPQRTPFEYVLLLQSPCNEEVKIDKVCLVGDSAKNGSDTAQFELEGPEPGVAKRGREAVLRLTYERQTPNEGGDSDQVAIVVQSNAENHPTLVIPLCARVVADGTEKSDLPCESPVVIEAGQKNAALCS